MDKDTEKHIIDAVNKLNTWKKRPGVTVIFDYIIKQNFIVSWDIFKTTFDNLVALNAIIKRKGKDSYYSNRENILPTVSNNNSIIEDMDIDELNQFNSNQSYKDALLANLYSTIEFLKLELQEKNNIIRSLFSQVTNLNYTNPNQNNPDDSTTTYMETRSEISSTDINSSMPSIPLSQTSIDASNNEVDNRDNNKSTIYSDISSCNNWDETFSSNDSNYNIVNYADPFAVEQYGYSIQLENYKLRNHIAYLSQQQQHHNNLSGEQLEIHRNNSNEFTSVRQSNNSINHIWPPNTILIASDSTLNQINEQKLSKHHNVKVRSFSGAVVEDMYCYLQPLLLKKPGQVILHIGTNNCPDQDANEILDQVLLLRKHIISVLPDCIVTLSQPIIRNDNRKAAATVRLLISKMNQLKIPMIDNSNIEEKHLSIKGLHLSQHGVKRMALNIITFLRNI